MVHEKNLHNVQSEYRELVSLAFLYVEQEYEKKDWVASSSCCYDFFKKDKEKSKQNKENSTLHTQRAPPQEQEERPVPKKLQFQIQESLPQKKQEPQIQQPTPVATMEEKQQLRPAKKIEMNKTQNETTFSTKKEEITESEPFFSTFRGKPEKLNIQNTILLDDIRDFFVKNAPQISCFEKPLSDETGDYKIESWKELYPKIILISFCQNHTKYEEFIKNVQEAITKRLCNSWLYATSCEKSMAEIETFIQCQTLKTILIFYTQEHHYRLEQFCKSLWGFEKQVVSHTKPLLLLGQCVNTRLYSYRLAIEQELTHEEKTALWQSLKDIAQNNS